MTARLTRTSLHDVIKVCSIEYFYHTNRISVANFQVLDHSQNYTIFNVSTIV